MSDALEELELHSLLLTPGCSVCFSPQASLLAPFSLSLVVGFLFSSNFTFVAEAASRAGREAV